MVPVEYTGLQATCTTCSDRVVPVIPTVTVTFCRPDGVEVSWDHRCWRFQARDRAQLGDARRVVCLLRERGYRIERRRT